MTRSTPAKVARRAAAVAAAGLAAVPFFPAAAHAAGPFTPGQLVVYRVGNAATPAGTSSATPVFLDEFPTTPSAAPTFSLALPTTASASTNALTASGQATSEGELGLSQNGKDLLVPGYDAPVGTPTVASTTPSASGNQREVAEVDGAGDIDTSTAFTSLYSGNNIRSAASPDGTTIYTGGPTSGIVSTTHGSTTGTTISGSSTTNFRVVGLFGSQVYATSASGAAAGLDLITGSGYTSLGIDSSGSSPYGFYLVSSTGGSTPDTGYVADSTAGAILKYTLSGGTWTADGQTSSAATAGVTGLTGTVTNGVVTLYASSPTNVVSITDPTVGTLGGAPTTLVTAPADEAFRGIAFAPSATTPPPATPESPAVFLLPLAAVTFGGAFLILRRRRQTRTSSAS